MVRALEIIGEAVKKIPDSIRIHYPQVPWREMTAMRNKLIHEYFGVKPRSVWETVKEELPVLKPIFDQITKDFPEN